MPCALSSSSSRSPPAAARPPTTCSRSPIRSTTTRTASPISWRIGSWRCSVPSCVSPDAEDWTRPANVDWYLPKVKMRFDHPNCPDDGENLIDREAITFANIHDRSHHTKSTLCSHNDGAIRSARVEQEAPRVLPPGRGRRRGAPGHPGNAVRRVAHVHSGADQHVSRRGLRPPGLVLLPVQRQHRRREPRGRLGAHDDSALRRARARGRLGVLRDARCRSPHRRSSAQLQWVDTHVVGYVADGSHATYEKAGEHPGPVVADHAYEGGPAWQTWSNFKNLGQVGKVLNDQDWVRYGGRWGEVGKRELHVGPAGSDVQRQMGYREGVLKGVRHKSYKLSSGSRTTTCTTCA